MQLKARLGAALVALGGCQKSRELTDLAQLPLPVNQWTPRMAGRWTDGWSAKADERYRILSRWPDAGAVHLCAFSGRIDPPDYDLEDAVEQLRVCPPQDDRGLTTAEIRVPAGANAVWYSIDPAGDVRQLIELRFERQ